MILRITIDNLYSFKDKTEISFAAGKGTIHEQHLWRAVKRDDISILKAGIIYGANASGKSNVIKAVSLLQNIATGGFPKQKIEPFKLSKASSPSSSVEIEFKLGKKFYAYGIDFTFRGIDAEWLFEINRRTEKEIFSRKHSDSGDLFVFGKIKGGKETEQLVKFISQITPSSKSFLSEYVNRNGKGINTIAEVYDWFKNNLKIIFPGSRYSGISFRVEKDKNFSEATKSLLKYFNTGIVDIRRIEINKEDLILPKGMVENILSESEPNSNFIIASPYDSTTYFFETDRNGVTTIYKQNTIHKSDLKKDIPFEMEEESDGSIRLLDFIPMLIDLRVNDAVYLVDEIDRSMHPMPSQKLLEYYFEYLSGERDTQLICTTHESNLLNLELLRADEVWFVEKDREGATHLTSLAEYKPREDVRKGYLQGRYGAIPFFAPIKSLNW